MKRVILLVEDDANDSVFLKRAFEQTDLNFRYECVFDGEQAMDYIKECLVKRKSLPALILLDLKLPKKDGFEFLSWRGTQNEVKRVPVLVLASSADPDDINRAYDLGANSYLVKPCNFNKLTAMLKGIANYWAIFHQHTNALHAIERREKPVLAELF